MNPSRQLALGVLIVSTLSLLAYYTLFLTESSLFGDKEQITITFNEARGLRSGDAVLVAGVRWGRIAEVEYDSTAKIDSRITVTATLTNPVEFREGASFQIKDSTLLGGRVLSIDPGPPGAELLPLDSPYQGSVVTSPLDAMGELIANNGDALSETLKDFQQIVKDANAGKGVIGQLLKNDRIAADLEATMGHVESITGTISRGEGNLGMLLKTDELYKSILSSAGSIEVSLDNIRKTTDGVERGDGMIGALLKDEVLAENVRGTVASIKEIARRIEDGEGMFGKLSTDEEVFKNIKKIAKDIAEVSEKIKEGEGTLGMLVMDDGLYKEIENALGLITRSLEEYREAAPVTTMTSVLFSAF